MENCIFEKIEEEEKESEHSPEELFNFGMTYLNGIDVSINLKEAENYFKLSASLGNCEAMCNYGVALERGYSNSPNLIEAMKWFKQSADLEMLKQCTIMDLDLKKDIQILQI
jgi:TPR repeat protein